MSFASYRTAFAAIALFIASSIGLRAQEHMESPAPAACGTHIMEASSERAQMLENTRRSNPALYDRIASGKRNAAGVMSAAQFDEYTFLVRNRVTNELEEIQAALVYTGPYSRVWVDVRDTGKATHKPTSTTMRTLVKALDSAVDRTNVVPRRADQGILKNDIDVFGAIPTRFNVENRTDFLLLDIKDAVVGQNVLGYFSPTDQTTNNESNQMNLLYIDSREGFQNLQTLLAIIAHEFQHLIHYGRHETTGSDATQRDVVFNEGMSEVASILNGYHFRANSAYLANTNINFFEWHYDDATDQEIDYQRAMTFGHYMSEHYGERFLYEFVGSPERNMARVSDALRRIDAPAGVDYQQVLMDFAVANYLQSSSIPTYNYRYKLKGGAARAHQTHTGTSFPAEGSAVLEGYGSYYLQYNDAGPMRFRYSGSSDVNVVMMGIRPTDTTIMQLQQNTDYTIPVAAGGPYRRFVLAFVNLGGGKRDVNWTAQALTSSADAGTASTGALSIGSLGNNGDGTATLVYGVPTAGSVTIDLFDARGQLVRTVLDDAERTAGTHRTVLDMAGLASGAYLTRIVQNGRAASGLVLVSR